MDFNFDFPSQATSSEHEPSHATEYRAVFIPMPGRIPWLRVNRHCLQLCYNALTTIYKKQIQMFDLACQVRLHPQGTETMIEFVLSDAPYYPGSFLVDLDDEISKRRNRLFFFIGDTMLLIKTIVTTFPQAYDVVAKLIERAGFHGYNTKSESPGFHSHYCTFQVVDGKIVFVIPDLVIYLYLADYLIDLGDGRYVLKVERTIV